MKRTELARLLHGSERPIARDLSAKAARAGLVILTGPFAHFDGAIEGTAQMMDDDGNSTSGTVYFDARGVLPEYDDIDTDSEADARDYFDRKRLAASVDVTHHSGGRYRWTFSTAIPHSTFDMLDDGELYARGIVFSLADAGLHVGE